MLQELSGRGRVRVSYLLRIALRGLRQVDVLGIISSHRTRLTSRQKVISLDRQRAARIVGYHRDTQQLIRPEGHNPRCPLIRTAWAAIRAKERQAPRYSATQNHRDVVRVV